jgi:hypothetical protein
MNKSVWVIEDGDYSDYRVLGVFTSKENADTVQKVSGGNVSEWPVNPSLDEINTGRKVYDVKIDRYGNTSSVSISREWVAASERYFEGWLKVWAKDEKHAVKVANELRLLLIAQGEW